MQGTLCILLTVIHTGSGYVWRTGLNIFCISDTLIWPRTCSASRVTRRGLSTVLRDCCAGLWRVTMFICSPSPLQTVWRRWRVRSASCWVPGEESDPRLSSLWYLIWLSEFTRVRPPAPGWCAEWSSTWLVTLTLPELSETDSSSRSSPCSTLMVSS